MITPTGGPVKKDMEGRGIKESYLPLILRSYSLIPLATVDP